MSQALIDSSFSNNHESSNYVASKIQWGYELGSEKLDKILLMMQQILGSEKFDKIMLMMQQLLGSKRKWSSPEDDPTVEPDDPTGEPDDHDEEEAIDYGNEKVVCKLL
ncbi:hypothetical protein L1987_86069 [Smallanthus sonchifolius]|uniref:Uncharacterized protein n=1 Tax=Smallanthus sonchifolius TaxID=185202 RepID=A0ACB8Y2H4_9ASTR|nr:hypothetical protein L1987_86069 [Smallanthus sonchifolius]